MLMSTPNKKTEFSKCLTGPAFHHWMFFKENYESLKVVENRIEQCCVADVQCCQKYTKQVVEPESSLKSSVPMLNNIVDNIKQYGQHNIV